MTKNTVRTGKKTRPKTAVKGKRYLCARCHKRSPKPVTTPAPWYCPRCRESMDSTTDSGAEEKHFSHIAGPSDGVPALVEEQVISEWNKLQARRD